MDKVIYTFWTGDNQMSDIRIRCLSSLTYISELPVVVVTPKNLHYYTDKPIHEAYQYLSLTHKADYLRTHFMHYHGGGYSDIKEASNTWLPAYTEFIKSDKWICGYKEIYGGTPVKELSPMWEDLIGNGCYMVKAGTPLTEDWYNNMIEILDNKLQQLKLNPGHQSPSQQLGEFGYPMGWSEMLGEVFHKVIYKHRDRVLNTLPMCNLFSPYR